MKKRSWIYIMGCGANMYANGRGVNKDVNQAIKWYRQAGDNVTADKLEASKN
jgi:TPR repeat protein